MDNQLYWTNQIKFSLIGEENLSRMNLMFTINGNKCFKIRIISNKLTKIKKIQISNKFFQWIREVKHRVELEETSSKEKWNKLL